MDGNDTGPPDEPPAGEPEVVPQQAAGGSVRTRLIGAGLAFVGVALLVAGLITLRGKPGDGDRAGPPGATGTSIPGGASAAPSAGTAGGSRSPSSMPSTGGPSGGAPSATSTGSTPGPGGSTGPSPTGRSLPRAPLTVLNNTYRSGLAEQAAARFTAAGWPVVLVGNYTGKIPTTTVYYSPGDGDQQRAAEELAREFTGIHRVLTRYAGLPPTPAGLVVVLTPDWTSETGLEPGTGKL